MLTSWSEQSTPAELSIASVLIRPPHRSNSIAAQRGDAQVAALANDFGAQLVCVDPHRVVGPVTDVGVGLRFGLDVGADAAVEQQVDRRLQDRPHQAGRRHLGDVVVDAQRGANLRR